MLAHAVIAALSIAAILAMWSLLAATCLGLGGWYFLGLAPRGRIGRDSPPATFADLLAAFWLGLATLFAILQLWHFFAPINGTAHAVILTGGFVGALALLPKLWRSVRSAPRKQMGGGLLAFALVAIFLANRATGPGTYYDSGLYHIAAVKWTNTYPIVPGLANLHMRLGFSSTLTLLAALLNQGGWEGGANHLVNGFLLASLAVMIVRSATKVFAGTAGPQHWAMLFSSMLLTDWAMDIQASSYSADLGVAALTVVAAYYFLELFVVRPAPKDAAAATMICVALLAATVTAKASALVMGGPMIAVTWLILWRATPGGWGRRLGSLLPSAGLALVLVAGWVAREIILTGYPLYPSEAFALPVDWAVPHEKVAWLRRIILDYGRWKSYDDTRSHWNWLKPWWQMRMLDGWSYCKGLVPLGIGAIAWAAAGGVGAAGWLKQMGVAWRGVFWLLGCVAIAMFAWWNSAPDPRYATQVFVLFMAGGLVLIVGMMKTPIGKGTMIGVALLLAATPLWLGSNAAAFFGARVVKDVWILPPEKGWMYDAPRGKWTELVTKSGVKVYVPVPAEGETFEDRAWDAPLPATPRSEIEVTEVVIPELKLRKAGDLGSGFKR
jgi:hypothetical protein